MEVKRKGTFNLFDDPNDSFASCKVDPTNFERLLIIFKVKTVTLSSVCTLMCKEGQKVSFI